MSRFSRKWLYIYFSFLCSHRRSALISLYIICQSCVTLYRWSIYRGGCVFPVEKANNDARGRRKMLVEREWGKNLIPMGYLRNFPPLVQKGLPVVCVRSRRDQRANGPGISIGRRDLQKVKVCSPLRSGLTP